MTPLHKKLGIKSDSVIIVLNEPKNYTDFFSDFPSNVIINCESEGQKVEFIHIFVTTLEELEYYYALAKNQLDKKGMLWISWPKKTGTIKTELNKFVIMKHGLDNGLVDVKVASIDDTWSAHKFVFRLKDR